MEVKHQVFVSSTYRDLVEERKAVIHALLELDCIPAGMELFPAADEDAWTLIKDVIDGCDYYVLILAGKYGSQNSEGIGYTEMEFDYAVLTGKPIIAFLHENPEILPSANTEKTEALQAKLATFREKAKAKHCKFWTNPEDLGGKVSRSLIQLRKRHPSAGWIPGKYAATDSLLRELQELRARVAQFELEAAVGSSSAPPGTDQLAQGTDLVYHSVTVITDEKGVNKKKTVSATWDTIFSYIGPSMMNECTDEEMMDKAKLAFYHALVEDDRKHTPFSKIGLPYVLEDRLRVQFQALGLIAPGMKRRAVSDRGRYWRLTPYGERHLLNIKAERKRSN
ncbi:DUF4062 domain-containing protein [Limnobacter sp.]|uniref:DUF4062 domain-containing protein n=1 Tax=Limnobacter sp. TaxID=2003368 RepID=UPI0025C1E0D3|nr:DUF4062 domain-containing protein [Limnobacter sp.]